MIDGYSYSSTQVNLTGEAAAAVKKLGKSIPDDDLAEDGRESEPHITLKYGLHTSDPAKVAAVLRGEKPIRLKLGKTSTFPPNKDNKSEVVKVEVHSADLHRLNKKISDALEHTDSFPNYTPHATIAYVKPGKAKKHTGHYSLIGKEVLVNEVVFSSKDGKQTKIPLNGPGRKYYGEDNG